MNTKEWLDLVAYTKEVENSFSDGTNICYFSKYDDSYITMEGQEENISYLAEREIIEQLTHGVGFSPKDNKWYGWSHRAISGFAEGSTCKKGDCHYTASTPEELIEDHANFYAEFGPDEVKAKRAECQILPDRSGIRILQSPILIPIATVDNLVDALEGDVELPVGDISGCYEVKCGRGEWVAETMEDARQMAIDFSDGVS